MFHLGLFCRGDSLGLDCFNVQFLQAAVCTRSRLGARGERLLLLRALGTRPLLLLFRALGGRDLLVGLDVWRMSRARLGDRGETPWQQSQSGAAMYLGSGL